MTVIKREEITNDTYREILDTETHHDHVIIKDAHGTIRWMANERVRKLVDKIGLNDLISLLHYLGYGKNSEIYRKMYREIGYSLSGYWEIFYWQVNNKKAADYKPPTK